MIAAALAGARTGGGASLCFTGAAGLGKTSLLDASAEAAAGEFHCLRVTGVPSEFTIGHAGLADIVTPVRERVADIPPPQRAALESALGWSTPTAEADRFLVGAATVSVLSLASRKRPVLLLIDDLQWVDRESQTALLFAARRIRHDAIVMIFARRDESTGPDLADINEFRLSGLTATDSVALLSERKTNPAVVERLVSETGEIRWRCSRRSASSARSSFAGLHRCLRCCRSGSGSATVSWRTSRSSPPARVGRWSLPRRPPTRRPDRWWPHCAPRVSIPTRR